MTSKSHVIASDTARLRVRVAENDGQPTLLLHGGPGGTDYLYKFFALQLRDAGRRPVGLIQRGSPGSPSSGPFTVDAFIEDIETIRRELDFDTIGIIGHSWGGLLGTLYASHYPNKVEELHLICPIGARRGWQKEFDQTIQSRLSEGDVAAIDHYLEKAAEATTPEERAKHMFQVQNIRVFAYYSPTHREGQPGLAHLEWRVREQIMRDLRHWYDDSTWEHGLGNLHAHSSVIWGADDPVPDHVAEEFAEMLPDPLIIKMENCGHFPWMEEPAKFAAAFERVLGQ